MWAIASTEAPSFRRQLFWHLTRTLVILLVCGIPLVLLTAPPPVDFVELCLRRDAYREALGQSQQQPSPCQIVRALDGRMLAQPQGDFASLSPGQIGLLQSLPRVYGLRLQLRGGEVWVQASLPRGFYQMSGSQPARLRVVLGFTLFYLLLLISSSLWVRRLNGRIAHLRQLAGHLAAGDLQARLESQPGDSAEYDHLRRRLLAMAEAIGHRRQAELEQREQLEREAAERNRRLAEVSHDLRTPLTSVLGYAQLYREEGHAALEVIESQGQALLLRVGQWLESCRLESAILDVRPLTCDLHDLIEEGFHLASQRHPMQAEVELPEKSPVIQADPYLFPRILSHLLLDLACSEVSISLQRPHLRLTGSAAGQSPKDEALLSPEGCSQLLAVQGVKLDRLEHGFCLTWEIPWKA
ncbi:MAG: histidine kinase dimerization/phospho-acceptor domain-containing protein [Vulcanimicrobiota bacterium]